MTAERARDSAIPAEEARRGEDEQEQGYGVGEPDQLVAARRVRYVA